MNDNLMNNLKLAKFLADKGLLTPLVNSYTEYRTQQNFPYIVKDRRLFKVAIMKALLQIPDLARSNQNPTISFANYVGEIADDMVKNLYGEEKTEASITELMKQYGIPPEYGNLVSQMVKTMDEKSLEVWLKNASKNIQERKKAELDKPEQAKEVQDKKMDKEMKEIMDKKKTEMLQRRTNPIYAEVGISPEVPKKVIKKRIIRKRSKLNKVYGK